MNYNSRKVFVWFKISLISVIFRPKSVHLYLNCNPLYLYILRFFNLKILRIDLEKNVFDSKKNNFVYQIDYFINKYSNKIFGQINKNAFKYARHNLVDRIYLSFISEDIKSNCNFFVRTKEKIFQKYSNNKIIYIFDKTEFSKILLIQLKKKYRNIDFRYNRNLCKINLFLKVVFLNFTLAINNFRFNKHRLEKPKIFQEYIENIFNRYPNSGHLFWLKKSKIKISDISWFTFNRNRKNNFYNKIKKKNEKIFKINNFDLLNFKDIYQDNFLYHVKKNLFKNKNQFKFLLLEFFIKYKINHYEKFIKKHNIKIFHHYQEPHYINLTLAYSCKETDCIFIWNHWSIDQRPVFYNKYGFCDILISWGEWNTSYMNSHDFIYDYIFVTGMVAGDKFVRSKNSSSRSKIVLFDSTSNLNLDNLHHPTFLLEKYYDELLCLLVNKKIKFLIKPKGSIHEKFLSNNIIDRIQNLQSLNKVKIISHKYPPSIIGNLNDLFICWGHNTAGNIVNLQNKNVLYYDNCNLNFHPFARKKFVIKKFGDLKKNIKFFLSRKKNFIFNNNEKKLISEFEDNYCNERAAFIFENYFKTLQKKKIGKQKLLDNLIFKYQKKYGKKRTIAKKGKLSTSNIWEKEIKKIELKYKEV